MDSVKLSLLFLFLTGFACADSSNPITSLFGKSHDEKSESEAKTGAATTTTTTTTAKPAGDGATATTLADPNSACGGLKGFLHMCQKAEPTEPPKNIKTRSAPEEDSNSSSDEDDDSDEDKEEPKPNTDKNEEEKEVEEEEGEAEEEKEAAEKAEVRKREATATAGPPPVGDPYVPSEIDVEAVIARRQADDPDSISESWEEEEEVARGRRECRDDGRVGEKDCRRRRRELVPDLVPRVHKTTPALTKT